MAEQAIEAGVMVLYEASAQAKARQAGVMVLHQTAPATAKARVAGTMVLFEAVAAVAEATVDLLAGKPEQFYLIHDSLAVGASVVESAGSEFGPRLGPAQPGTANQGSIIPSILGDPNDNTDVSLNFEIVRGGGISTAEWAYQPENGNWYGHNDMLYLWGTHPVKGAGDNRGGIVLYSSVFRRILVLTSNPGVEGTGSVEIRYVDADDRPQTNTDWTNGGTFNPEGGVFDGTHPLAGCELRDGSLLLAVQGYQLSTTEVSKLADGDIWIYRSTDGGLTWVKAAERVLTEAARVALVFDNQQRPSGEGTIRMAASGDWIRLCYMNQDDGISCVVSADAGATWTYGSELTTTNIEAAFVSSNNDEQPYDLIGLDDNAGSFLLAFRGDIGTSKPTLYFGYASRDDDWTLQDMVFGNFDEDTIRSICMFRTPSRIQILLNQFKGSTASADAAYDRWTMVTMVPEFVPGEGSGILQQDFYLTHYAARYRPLKLTATWCGDRAAILYYIEDSEQGVPSLVNQRPYMAYAGGWSGRPIAREFGNYRYETLHWQYTQGVPAGLPSSASSTWASDWSATLAAGGTFQWSVNGLEFQTSGIGDQSYQSFGQLVSGATLQPGQWDYTDENYYLKVGRWVAEWVCSVGNTSPVNDSNVATRFRMTSAQAAGAQGWNLVVRHGPTNVVLYDDIAGAPLLTISNLELGGSYEEGRYFRCRLAVSPATTEPSFLIMARDERGGEWQEAGPVQIARAALVIPGMSFRFGNLNSNTGSTVLSRWREFRIMSQFFRTNYAHPSGYTVPGDLAGAPAALIPFRLGSGSTNTDPARLKAAWGGGSGVAGDTYSWQMSHTHPAEHIFLDSPQYPWLSAAGATAGVELVFDASGDTGRPNRWAHNAAALFDPRGAQTVKLSYANDTAFSVGLTEQNISLVQHSGIPISNSNGNLIGFLATSVGATQIRDGALVGKYIKVTAETSGSGRVGHVHKVLRHWREGDTHLIELSSEGQFDPDSILVGDTVSVLSDRVMHRWADLTPAGKRYMKLTFGATGENNWDGRWGLARLVVGMAKKFDPPLQWQYSDNQTPDTTEVRGRSGASWAYKNAEPERRIMGRWTGSTKGEHRAFRDALANLAGYQVQPIALLLDDDNRTGIENDLLLTRFDGSVGLDQQAWKLDETHGYFKRPVGDMQVFFKELI